MKYSETLALAKANNIDILDLMVADEVDCQNDNIIKDDDYEMICDYVKRLYLKTEHIALDCIVCGVLTEIKKGDLTIDKIKNHQDRTEDYDILDIICQIYA